MSLQLNNATQEDVLRILQYCRHVYDQYEIIIEANVADYFVHDLWQLIPKDWALFLEMLAESELSSILSPQSANNHPNMPESLRQLCYLIPNVSLSRDAPQRLDSLKIQTDKWKHKAIVEAQHSLPLYTELTNPSSNISRLMFHGLKLKQRHVLMVMSNMVYKTYLECPTDVVVHVGGGTGYLARILAYIFNIRVISIDFKRENNTKACEQQLKCIRYLRKNYSYLGDNLNNHPFYVRTKPGFRTTPTQFLDLLHETLKTDGGDLTYGIIGMHSSGNLAPILLRLYKYSSSCKFINLCSDGYEKLFMSKCCESIYPDRYGYPMSVVPGVNMQLSRNARELACHSVETFLICLLDRSASLKSYVYRAALEEVFVNRRHDKSNYPLRNITYREGMTFEQYVERSIVGKHIWNDLVYNSYQIDARLQDWKRVLIFHTIQQMFAPLLETMVLLDRYLFAKHEASGYVNIMPVFRKDICPRVHFLVAMK